MGSPVRVSAITSNASLVVALTLRVEDWEVQSGGTASALPDLELTDVLLIDRGNTAEGLAELSEARTHCPDARAIIIGDQEAAVSELDNLLLRPFTLEDLANAINEAGSLVADVNGEAGTDPDEVIALDDATVDEWEEEPEPFDADDMTSIAAPTPTPGVLDRAMDDELVLEPPRDEDRSEPVDDEPATFEPEDELDFVVTEPVVLEPAEAVGDEEPAPFATDLGPAAPSSLEEDEPSPFAADFAPATPSTLEDDELEPWGAEAAVTTPEAVVADELAASPAVVDRGQPAPPTEQAAAEPSAQESAEELEPARATGRGGTRPKRKDRRRRKKGEPLPGPTELAAELMAAVAPRTRSHTDLNARIAEIITAGLDMEDLLEEMPIMRSRSTLGTAVAAELHQDLGAETVSVWVPTVKGFKVVGGWGLTRAELKAAVPATQPLLSELSETGGATLIVPIDLAGAAVAGIAGARTEALMATAIGIGDHRYAFVALGADDYDEDHLDSLVEMAVEAAPLFAVAAMIDRLRETET